MPVATDGAPLAPERQRRAGSNGRPLRGGGEVVVLRQGNEVRVAVVANGRVRRAWRITSATPRRRGAAGTTAREAPRARRSAVLGELGRVRRAGSRSARLGHELCTRHSGLGGDGAARSLPTRRRLSLPARLGPAGMRSSIASTWRFADVRIARVRRRLRRRRSPWRARGQPPRTTRGSSRTTATPPPRRRPRTSHATARRPSRFELGTRATSGAAAAGTTTTRTTHRAILTRIRTPAVKAATARGSRSRSGASR